MNTDPIADFLTRIRNANSAGSRTVVIPSSKIKNEITKILGAFWVQTFLGANYY